MRKESGTKRNSWEPVWHWSCDPYNMRTAQQKYWWAIDIWWLVKKKTCPSEHPLSECESLDSSIVRQLKLITACRTFDRVWIIHWTLNATDQSRDQYQGNNKIRD
jgi:hypothetical protein